MSKFKAIWTGQPCALTTVGRIYEIQRKTNDGFYEFINDLGEVDVGPSHCFNLVESPPESGKPTQFKVGDIVEAFGLRGKVKFITQGYVYPVEVEFDHVCVSNSFTMEGLQHTLHKLPSLKLIERPKKKVKKTIERWMNVYDGFETVDKSLEAADQWNCENRIACIKLTGEYEVEE